MSRPDRGVAAGSETVRAQAGLPALVTAALRLEQQAGNVLGAVREDAAATEVLRRFRVTLADQVKWLMDLAPDHSLHAALAALTSEFPVQSVTPAAHGLGTRPQHADAAHPATGGDRRPSGYSRPAG